MAPANLFPVINENLIAGVTADPTTGDLYYSATGGRTVNKIPHCTVVKLEGGSC